MFVPEDEHYEYVRSEANDSVEADAYNMLAAVLNGELERVDYILRARQPDEIGSLAGYLAGTVLTLLAHLTPEMRKQIMAEQYKAADAKAAKYREPDLPTRLPIGSL